MGPAGAGASAAPASGAPAVRRVELATGTLHLGVDDADRLDRLCDFAARRNPRRGFLVVSRVLGRHLPARPAAMRASMAELAAPLARAPLDGPVLFLGMAETATALGHGVHDAWRAATGRDDSVYLQSSRQRVAGATPLARFEEGHSHASTHLVQVDPSLLPTMRSARTLVVVDDECSTGATFVAAAEALVGALPALESVHTAVITDWSDGRWTARMPRPTVAHAALSGTLRWEPPPAGAGDPGGAGRPDVALVRATNAAGTAPAHGTPARRGFARYPEPARTALDPGAPARWTVLGDGEFSWEALLVAEAIEAAGGTAFVQCITRSPVLIGHAMRTSTALADSYGSGAPCFVHNLLGAEPERVAVVSENEGAQAREIGDWLRARGRPLPVSLVVCRFPADRPPSPGPGAAPGPGT